jgi:hypothetical protein
MRPVAERPGRSGDEGSKARGGSGTNLPLWRLRLARLRRLWLRRLRLLLVMGTLPHLLRALLQSPGAITAAGLRQGDGEAGLEVTDVLHAWLGSTLT